MRKNIVTMTDSYKLAHWQQYPPGTEVVYSYFEAREGAVFPETVFFGLQYLLKEYLAGEVVTKDRVDQAELLVEQHLGDRMLFNRVMWDHIIKDHGGRLPVEIKAVPEGTVVPINNVMMTVENTCLRCAPLTNHLETLLCHIWHACTVATLSREVKKMIRQYLRRTSDNLAGLDFMLHDFGYRGVSSNEAAAIGGLAHLVNFKGTDTVAALEAAQDYYHHQGAAAFSVPATEHSVMTAEGPDGECSVIGRLLEAYPKGILSVVADSFDYFGCVENIIGGVYRNDILARDGIFVVRPDSGDPITTVIKTLDILASKFGNTVNSKGFKVLPPQIRVLWGDGLDLRKISEILDEMERFGWSAENMATFGMGGGLLQKVNRDTQRFAFKCSAQRRNRQWHDIFKDPTDGSKKSKRGRLMLYKDAEGNYQTLDAKRAYSATMSGTTKGDLQDELVTVFRNGEVILDWTLDQVRERASI